jgi:hypothetical protein
MTLQMVESCATHNFMMEYVAWTIGLKFKQAQNSFEEVNSGEHEVGGTSKNVPMNLREWTRRMKFTIV